MARIRLSRKAIADLDGIGDYTAQTWSEEFFTLFTSVQNYYKSCQLFELLTENI